LTQPRKTLTPAEWDQIHDRYVYGEQITITGLAELLGISRVSIEKRSAPRNNLEGMSWRDQRQKAQKDLQLDARARLIREASDLDLRRGKDFEARYEETTDKVNDLLDMLLDDFVPPVGATDVEVETCRAQLNMLSANQRASLIMKCTERLAGVAKTRQLLSGEVTERLLVDIKNAPDVVLTPETEAQIEDALTSVRAALAASSS